MLRGDTFVVICGLYPATVIDRPEAPVFCEILVSSERPWAVAHYKLLHVKRLRNY